MWSSATVWENRLYEIIDFFISASHVDFLKAHIKLSNLANFQNFSTTPHWLAGVRKECIRLFIALFSIFTFFTKSISIFSFGPNLIIQTHISEHFSWSTLHESNKKIFFLTKSKRPLGEVVGLKLKQFYFPSPRGYIFSNSILYSLKDSIY